MTEGEVLFLAVYTPIALLIATVLLLSLGPRRCPQCKIKRGDVSATPCCNRWACGACFLHSDCCKAGEGETDG